MNQHQQSERTPPPTRNWKRPAMITSPAMRMALERAREAQPPLRPLAGKAGTPWRAE